MESTRFSRRLSYAEANEKLGHSVEQPPLRTVPSYYDYFLSESNDEPSQLAKDWDVFSSMPITANTTTDDLLEEVYNKNSEKDWATEITDDHWRLADRIDVLNNFQLQVANCLKMDSYHPIDARQRFVINCFETYQAERTDKESTRWNNTVAQSLDFLKFYTHGLDEYATTHNVHEKITIWRQELLDFINSDEASVLFPANRLPRISDAIKAVPITILDPISSLNLDNEEYNGIRGAGSFDSCSRQIRLNLLANQEYTSHYDFVRFDTALQGTFLHELIHTISNEYYHENRGFVQVHTLWPKFWTEGMTEKITNYIQAKLHVPETPAASRPGHWSQRTFTTEALLVTDETLAFTANNPAIYGSYRALIDIVMDQLDWSQAQLTYEEASTLAIHAFTEAPEDSETSSTSKRLEFIEAVNAASHPGFFMKLQHAVDMHGVEFVTKILESSRFEPHDSQSLTFTTTKQHREYLAQCARMVNSLHMLPPDSYLAEAFHGDASASKEELSGITELKHAATRSNLLQAALKAECIILMNKNGVNSDLAVSLTETMLGYKSEQLATAVDRGLLKTAEQEMSEWINSLRPSSE